MAPENSQTAELLEISILDTLATLGERRGKDLLGQLFSLFLEQGPKGFGELRKALDEGNAGEVKSVAHSLKGSYRSLGTPRLAELSRRLEELGTSGRLAGGQEVLSELETCFDQTSEALKHFLDAKKAGSGGVD